MTVTTSSYVKIKMTETFEFGCSPRHDEAFRDSACSKSGGYSESEAMVKLDDELKDEPNRLAALSEEELDREFKNRFHLEGTSIPRELKIDRLMATFSERNIPDAEPTKCKIDVDKRATLWEKISDITKVVAQYVTRSVRPDEPEVTTSDDDPSVDCDISYDSSECGSCLSSDGSPECSECSSSLSYDEEFYDSDESCDYSGYSHDYHCSKCSKMRAYPETKLNAKFRVDDKLKVIKVEEKRLNALSDEELGIEFRNVFQVAGKTIDRAGKVARLMDDFVRKNRPYKEYRLANKLYDKATSIWKVSGSIELETIDVVNKILAARIWYHVSVRDDLPDDFRVALKSDKECRREKTSAVYKLTTAPLGLCSNSVERYFQRMCAICIEILFADEFKRIDKTDDNFNFQNALKICLDKEM